jgi:hypothetical protein
MRNCDPQSDRLFLGPEQEPSLEVRQEKGLHRLETWPGCDLQSKYMSNWWGFVNAMLFQLELE